MKKNLVNLKRLFNCKEFYFDIHQEQDAIPPTNSKEGFFGYFKVVQTPALMIFSKEKHKLDFYSYRDLFANNQKLNMNNRKNIKRFVITDKKKVIRTTVDVMQKNLILK
jgi:hypothetical protein